MKNRVILFLVQGAVVAGADMAIDSEKQLFVDGSAWPELTRHCIIIVSLCELKPDSIYSGTDGVWTSQGPRVSSRLQLAEGQLPTVSVSGLHSFLQTLGFTFSEIRPNQGVWYLYKRDQTNIWIAIKPYF